MNVADEINGLLEEKYNCSQIMMILLQKLCGKENPDMLRAMAGLGGGLHCWKTCGTLTGGCCLLASCTAALPGEESKVQYKEIVADYVNWFEKEFGSIDCSKIINGEKKNIPVICPVVLEESFTKCMELLAEREIDMEELR